jgi:single-stranded DNA-binding protein
VNSLILNGRVVGGIKSSQTKTGVPKTIFVIETDGKDLPLRFSIVAFGQAADAANKLYEGDEVLIGGRLAADSNTKTMSIIATAIELFYTPEEPNDSNNSNESSAEKTPADNQQ